MKSKPINSTILHRTFLRLALIILIGVASWFSYKSATTIDLAFGVWAYVGILVAIIAGVFWEWSRMLSLGALAFAMFLETTAHSEFLLQTSDVRSQKSSVIQEQRNRFTKLGNAARDQSWSSRQRSIGEIEAAIGGLLNRRIPQYRDSVGSVTNHCTSGHKYWRAWRHCDKLPALQAELARAKRALELDRQRNNAYSRLDALEIVPRSNLFVSKISEWSRIDKGNIEVAFVLARVVGMQIMIAALVHLILAGTSKSPAKRGSKPGPKNTRRTIRKVRPQGPTARILPFDRRAKEVELVKQFLSNCTRTRQRTQTRATALYQAFTQYQQALSLPDLSQRRFGIILNELGLRKRKGGAGNSYHYLGYELIDHPVQNRTLSRTISRTLNGPYEGTFG